jgi:hypothetical protein
MHGSLLFGVEIEPTSDGSGDEISGTPSNGFGCVQFNGKSLICRDIRLSLRD